MSAVVGPAFDEVAASSVGDEKYRPFPPFQEWAASVTSNTAIWDQYSQLLASERQKAGNEKAGELVRGAMRAAATNTGAIEGLHGADRGLTISVLEQAVNWQEAVRLREGDEALELIEAALQGYEMALDLMTRNRAINEAWIRQVHATVCAPQKTYVVETPLGRQEHPLPLGEYKKSPNHVLLPGGGIHAYAPVLDTAPEMQRLVSELGTFEFDRAHGSLQAAYAHHALTMIHPFADGNGRVARVLSSVYTLRSSSIPMLVFVEDRATYYDSLLAADNGRPTFFVDFVISRAIDAISYLLEVIRYGDVSPSDYLSRLQASLSSHGGLTYAEIDAIGARLVDLLRQKLTTAVGELSLPPGVGWSGLGSSYPFQPTPGGYRIVSGAQSSGIAVNSAGPVPITVHLLLEPFVSMQENDDQPFLIRTYVTLFRVGQGQTVNVLDDFRARLSEVNPTPSTLFELRADRWARRILRDALQVLADSVGGP